MQSQRNKQVIPRGGPLSGQLFGSQHNPTLAIHCVDSKGKLIGIYVYEASKTVETKNGIQYRIYFYTGKV